ncbi:MAG: GNAT family N-acetyltransferase, partial [Actinomycetota bacterium]|nr:GNAT family N-acetyltransferase [Actinomycetota bacterium]
DEQYRGRGFATLLVGEATDRAQRVGAELIFLVADAEDWPKHLYSKLGYRASLILPTFNRDTSSTSCPQSM